MTSNIICFYLFLCFVSLGCAQMWTTQSTSQFRTSPFSDHGGHCSNDSFLLEHIVGPKSGYTKNRLPGGGVEVMAEIWIQELKYFSIDQTIEMDIYLSEMWLDPALAYGYLAPCKLNLTSNEEVLNKIWTPNNVFTNSRSSQTHESPSRNIFLMLYENGTVWTNKRLKLSVPCINNMGVFPFDAVTCSLVLESFTYNKDEVRMSWSKPGSLMIQNTVLISGLLVTNLSTKATESVYPGGIWSELLFKIEMKRRYGWYILNAYIPTSVAVVITWLSICFGTKFITARTMICVGSMILVTIVSIRATNQIPQVSYITAMDTWTMGCQLFILLILLELTIVAALSQKQQSKEKGEETLLYGTRKKKSKQCLNKSPCVLDAISAFVFATLFVLFVIGYCVLYGM